MNMKWYEVPIRLVLLVFVFTMLAVVGGLGIIGGDKLESENPNAFDIFGGYWLIHFYYGSFLVFWIIITIWILIIGREKEIYLEIKKYISQKRGKNAAS